MMKILRFLLYPFAVLYDLITTVRNYCFNTGIFKSNSFGIPVIAVGNLSVGGTGKTPQIEYLIRLLQEQYNVAVLSRGYGRKSNGFILIDEIHTALDVGDEPLQFYHKFPKISVAVDANRNHGMTKLLEKVNPDVILLDDAYQHRKVKAKEYILLTKYDDLYTNDFLLPTGNLRESRRGAKRAKLIVVTKCPTTLTKDAQESVVKRLKPHVGQKVFFTSIAYNSDLQGGEKLHLDSLRDKEIVLVTGIANPQPLLDYLKDKVQQLDHLKFSDHYNFNESDIEKIKERSTDKIVLTTEKDFMRLKGKIDSLFFLEISTQFLDGQQEEFDKEIQSYLA